MEVARSDLCGTVLASFCLFHMLAGHGVWRHVILRRDIFEFPVSSGCRCLSINPCPLPTQRFNVNLKGENISFECSGQPTY